ncbi:MAG: ABC transporter ATP-binding protein [Oligoflexales bacterium]|nr:ABC transporter ATP-binding protein [Oligoflexales bacterium]
MQKQNSASISDSILELKDISKTYKTDVFKKKKSVLENLSLKLKSGLCTGLLGHNGAGKTTTIKIILQLVEADQGSLFFNAKTLTRRDKVFFGYMAETNKLAENLSCEESLFQHLMLMNTKISRNDAKKMVQNTLETINLVEHKKKKIRELSKGMARRVAWGMATIHKPTFLILDEPFSGLDPWGRIQMEGWIKSLLNSGCSILLSTHELSTIETLCDEIYILNRGKVVYSSAETSPNLPSEHQKMLINKFYLKISGCDELKFKMLIKDKILPEYYSLEQVGFSWTFGFNEYENALSWLRYAVSSQWLVISFEQKKRFDNHELLKFFKN